MRHACFAYHATLFLAPPLPSGVPCSSPLPSNNTQLPLGLAFHSLAPRGAAHAAPVEKQSRRLKCLSLLCRRLLDAKHPDLSHAYIDIGTHHVIVYCIAFSSGILNIKSTGSTHIACQWATLEMLIARLLALCLKPAQAWRYKPQRQG